MFGSNAAPKRQPLKIQDKSDKVCPNCGKESPYYWLNCPSCGRKMK